MYFGLEKNKAIILAMAIVLFVSMAAGIASSLIESDGDGLPEQTEKVAVVINFGGGNKVDEVLDLPDGKSAHDMFNQLGTVTIDLIGTEFVIINVEADGFSAEMTESTIWVFYVNGILNFGTPDKYKPKHGDTIELRFEENPY